MKKEQKIFAALCLIALLSLGAFLVTSQSGESESVGPESVSPGQAYDWALGRVPQFFWLGPPVANEELRIDKSPSPEGQASAALGYLLPDAQKRSKNSPYIVSYLVQNTEESASTIASLLRKSEKESVLKYKGQGWTGYAVRRQKQIASLILLPSRGKIVGVVSNNTTGRNLQMARELFSRVELVSP